MALEIIVARQAETDLEELIAYVAEENAGAAQALNVKLENSIRLLSQHPEMGRLAPSTGQPRMRRFSVPPYIVFYRADDLRLEVARVLHSSRYLDDPDMFLE